MLTLLPSLSVYHDLDLNSFFFSRIVRPERAQQGEGTRLIITLKLKDFPRLFLRKLKQNVVREKNQGGKSLSELLQTHRLGWIST